MDLWGVAFGDRSFFDVVTDPTEPAVWVGIALIVLVVGFLKRGVIAQWIRWLWARRPVTRIKLVEALERAEQAEGVLAGQEARRTQRSRPKPRWEFLEVINQRRTFALANLGDGDAFDVHIHLPDGVMMTSSSTKLGDIPAQREVKIDAMVLDRTTARYGEPLAQVTWLDDAGDEQAKNIRIRFNPSAW